MKRMIEVGIIFGLLAFFWSGNFLVVDAVKADELKPVVTQVKDQSGPFNGYKITTPTYEFWVKCTNYYGFYGYELSMDDEPVAKNTGYGFQIYDDANKKPFFNNFGFKPNGYTVVQEGNKITWNLEPNPVCEYNGTLEWTDTKITITHCWMQHEDVTGRTIAAVLNLGIPMLTDCPFKAVLLDGSVVEGNIPADLPEPSTVYAGGRGGQGVKELTFFTKKGNVKFSFLPDNQTEAGRISQPVLTTDLRKDTDPPYRRYDMVAEIPAGKKGLAQTYTIVFEFPEN